MMKKKKKRVRIKNICWTELSFCYNPKDNNNKKIPSGLSLREPGNADFTVGLQKYVIACHRNELCLLKPAKMVKHKQIIVSFICNKIHTLIFLMPTCNIQKIVQFTPLLQVQKQI